MSADISAKGRLTRTFTEKETSTGSVMALGGMAIDITGFRAEEQQTLFVGLVAFGASAEKLLRYKKGDNLSVFGSFSKSPYTSSDGVERDGFSITVESCLGIRPKPARKKESKSIGGTASVDDLNDPLPKAMQ